MHVNIRMATDALRFQHRKQAAYEHINHIFYRQVKEKFTRIAGQLQEPEKELFRQGAYKIGAAMDGIWHAPEFVSRILDYPYEHEKQLLAFLLQAADAEIARSTAQFDYTLYPYLWTAKGDYLIQFARETQTYHEYHAFNLQETVTLDFFSPHCIKIDNKELEEDDGRIIEEYNYEEAFALYEKMEESIDPLCGFSNGVLDLVTHFTRVILFKKQVQQEPMLFSSASNFPYIGRSLLINAHKASASQLIDALVHESIHSLLYMIDVVEKWMPANAAIHRAGRSIRSPWTGRMLTPGNFCQAIFVWYGLFNFWQLALDKNIYDSEYAEKRLEMIKRGFEQVEIEAVNSQFDLQLQQAALETVASVREAVLQQAGLSAGID